MRRLCVDWRRREVIENEEKGDENGPALGDFFSFFLSLAVTDTRQDISVSFKCWEIWTVTH